MEGSGDVVMGGRAVMVMRDGVVGMDVGGMLELVDVAKMKEEEKGEGSEDGSRERRIGSALRLVTAVVAGAAVGV